MRAPISHECGLFTLTLTTQQKKVSKVLPFGTVGLRGLRVSKNFLQAHAFGTRFQKDSLTLNPHANFGLSRRPGDLAFGKHLLRS